MRPILRLFAIALLFSLLLSVPAQALAGPPPNRLDDNTHNAVIDSAINTFLTGALLPGLPSIAVGRTLSNPSIFNVYWDNNWNTDNPNLTTATIDDFTTKLAGSHYFDPAAQYGVGAASFQGSTTASLLCGPRNPGAMTGFVTILVWITCEASVVGTGVPFPNSNSLYVVYLPTGTTISSFGKSSCADFGAYHFFSAFPPTLQTFAFAVMPLDCAGGAGGTLDQMTPLATHEIIEAATDPIFLLGRIDDSKLDLTNLQLIATAAEAADICSGAGDVPSPDVRLANGLLVAPYWSNQDNACVPVPPATTLTVGPPRSTVNGVTALTSSTLVTLTTTPAGRSDAVTISYRYWRNGTPTPASITFCSSPCRFKLTAFDGADGTYNVEYSSTDHTWGTVEQTRTTPLLLDNTPPTCLLAGIVVGPPKQVLVTVQDKGSGLGAVTLTESTNATPSVPAFAAGTTTPVTITFTKSVQDQPASFGLTASDVAGNRCAVDPAEISLDRTTGRPHSVTIQGVKGYEQLVTVANGTPGLTAVSLLVNGKRFQIRHLRNGETAALTIGRALHPGAHNTVIVTPLGKPGGSAELLISGSTGGSARHQHDAPLGLAGS